MLKLSNREIIYLFIVLAHSMLSAGKRLKADEAKLKLMREIGGLIEDDDLPPLLLEAEESLAERKKMFNSEESNFSVIRTLLIKFRPIVALLEDTDEFNDLISTMGLSEPFSELKKDGAL